MKSIKHLLSSILVLLSFLSSNAQIRGITPLHKFMQVNADTTLMFEYESNWLGPPKYWLMSKKGDTTTAYIYDTAFKNNNVLMPRSVRTAINKVNGHETWEKIEVNHFFKPVKTPEEFKGKIWGMLMSEQPWNIADDNVDGHGCPIKGQNSHEISDGGCIKLYLITAKEIKTLAFYAPGFYEEHCPGRKGRKSILKIEKIFNEFFKSKN